jgi:hypothetical protein
MEKRISIGLKRSLANDKALSRLFDDLDTNGFCVVEDVLSAAEVSGIREKLVASAVESNRQGVPTHMPSLDPNVRVFNLLGLDPVFLELMERPIGAPLALANSQ